jgi:hypothetical protein
MTEYDVSDLVTEVKMVLDQNRTSTALQSDVDTLSLDAMIEGRLLDAIQTVEMKAPVYMLTDPATLSPNQLTTQTSGVKTVNLPTNFMRLISVRCSDWSRNAKIITDDDPLYAQQGGPGGKGNKQRPVAALVNGGSGFWLEINGTDQTTATVLYIPQPAVSSKKISMCRLLKAAAVHYCGYLVALSCGEKELADGLLKAANDMMQ